LREARRDVHLAIVAGGLVSGIRGSPSVFGSVSVFLTLKALVSLPRFQPHFTLAATLAGDLRQRSSVDCHYRFLCVVFVAALI